MSKAVRSVGKAIGNVVKGVVGAVKKVAKSKLGKIVLTAAAVYFGGAALMGAMGSGAAGAAAGGGWAGAQAGLASAWSGASAAGSALAAGEFGAAGSALSSGFTGGSGIIGSAASGAASTGLAGAVPAAPTGLAGAGLETAAAPGSLSFSAPATQFAAPQLGAPASKGLIAGLMESPYAAPALIQTGGQMISGLASGKAAQAQQDHQDKLSEEGRQRYNKNVGTRLWPT